MKADLYTAHARTAGSLGLAHRTGAGFIVLTTNEGDDIIALIDGNQNEPDLIDQVVSAAQNNGPSAFAMLFTAGGDLYAIASGDASVTVTSTSGALSIKANAGQVIVHAVAAGINEPDANVRLHIGEIADDSRTNIDLQAGTVEADWVEVAIGASVLAGESSSATPAAAAASTAEDSPAQPSEASAPDDHSDGSDDEPEVEPVAIIAPTEPEVSTPSASAAAVPEPPMPAPVPEPPTPEPVAIPEPPVPAPVPEPPTPEPAPVPEPPTPAPIPEPPTPAPAPVPEPPTPEPAPVPEPPTPAPAEVADESTPAKVGAAMVLGVACSQGHHNHPDAVYCSQCGTKMGVHHTTVLINGPRPPLGVLVVDDGTTYSLNQDLVIGREPTSHEDVVAGTASPMILTDDTLSLSRKHARVVLDDWSVGVRDLNSSNGTYLSRAGQAESWTKVEPSDVLTLEPGDRLRVGGRIIQVELHHVR